MTRVKKKLHILLVEDDDDHAELVAFNLEAQGIIKSLDRASDGIEALEYMKHCSKQQNSTMPDLILLDLKLPKMDGLEVLAELKRDEAYKSIPIVMLSTSDSEADQATAYQNYANGYMIKPMDFDIFVEMVRDFSNFWGKWNCQPKHKNE
ncbi:MAG: response regulator [Zetaproteobacteria bacterium]|nr:response regulator [Zetaproteobacteria bacterium]